MKVDKINSQTGFKSKFIPNNYLTRAFDNACNTNDRNFVKSVQALLNDGKNDTIKLVKNKSNMALLVNDQIKDEAIYSYYGMPAIDLINKYAKKLFDFNYDYNSGHYQNLSKKEKQLIKENADVIKLLSENLEQSSNYIEEVQKQLANITQKIDDNTKQEIQKLKKIIFGE